MLLHRVYLICWSRLWHGVSGHLTSKSPAVVITRDCSSIKDARNSKATVTNDACYWTSLAVKLHRLTSSPSSSTPSIGTLCGIHLTFGVPCEAGVTIGSRRWEGRGRRSVVRMSKVEKWTTC
ncbi:hypothetical protein F5X68DRAFT_4029 [Plectosphaerella plurivora]|uniref:Secreted protein n=1 Tax=Plectosphaerella plurivora TaxID=936078 RepID=A0A9P9ADB0_9PEZI|nr:hypothetical protein F5X68DRAFT_4029 [Plectosphaerella plurivora]